MADNITLSGGEVVSTDEVGGVHTQLAKAVFSTDGAAPTHVSAADPLPVTNMQLVNDGGVAANPSLVKIVTLSKDGDGSTFNAAADYSVTPARFLLKPPAGKHYLVKTLVAYSLDVTTQKIAEAGYLALTLANGIGITVRDLGTPTTVIDELLGGRKIVNARDWMQYAETLRYEIGTTLTAMQNRLTFPAMLHTYESGGGGEMLSVDLSDDFSGLTEMVFTAHVLELSTTTKDAHYRILT